MTCIGKILTGLTNGSSFAGVFPRDYTIANAEFDLIECACVQFDERDGEPGEHDSARRYDRSCFHDASLTIDGDDVDRETHPESVDALTGRNNECVIAIDGIASKQPSFSRCAVARNFDARRQDLCSPFDRQTSQAGRRKQP